MKIKIRYEMRPKWKATSFLQKETSVYLKIQHQFRHLMLRHKTHVHVFFLMTFIGVQMRSCCYKIVKCYLMHRHNLIIFFFVPFIYDSSFMYSESFFNIFLKVSNIWIQFFQSLFRSHVQLIKYLRPMMSSANYA